MKITKAEIKNRLEKQGVVFNQWDGVWQIRENEAVVLEGIQKVIASYVGELVVGGYLTVTHRLDDLDDKKMGLE